MEMESSICMTLLPNTPARWNSIKGQEFIPHQFPCPIEWYLCKCNKDAFGAELEWHGILGSEGEQTVGINITPLSRSPLPLYMHSPLS